MLIHHRGAFVRGLVMISTFFGVCTFLLFPMLHDNYGNKLTGLQYADAVFNSLSKGSSYFIPEVKKEVETVKGKEIQANVPLKHELSSGALRVLDTVGAEASYEDGRLTFKGNLETILLAVTEVGDKLYFNEHKPIELYYHMPALHVSKVWWYILNPSIKDMQRQGKIAEAKVIDQVLRRALEPGNNFYTVDAAKVSEHILLIVGMLAFYILYTLWYGFGIFEFFEGIGLSMHKK